MKKTAKLLTAFLLAAAPLTACAGQSETADDSMADLITVQVNVDGLGYIAVSEDGTQPVIDEEYPSTSVYMNVDKGKELILTSGSREEEWKFVRWTKDGNDYSDDETITVTIDEPTEYIAVFMMDSGYDGEAVTDINDVKTLGDVLALPTYGSGFGSGSYVYAFDLNGRAYQAVADLDEELSEKLFALEFDDPEYDSKLNALIAPLEVKELLDLNDMWPSEEDLKANEGKTFGELFDEGWSCMGWNFDDNVAYLDYKWFSYEAEMEGVINKADFDEDALAKLTVKSMTCTGIGDAAYYDYN